MALGHFIKDHHGASQANFFPVKFHFRLRPHGHTIIKSKEANNIVPVSDLI